MRTRQGGVGKISHTAVIGLIAASVVAPLRATGTDQLDTRSSDRVISQTLATTFRAVPSDSASRRCAPRIAVPEQLRPLDCRLAAAIADGLTRSATFRQLVGRVGALNGIIYIHLGPYVNPQTLRVL